MKTKHKDNTMIANHTDKMMIFLNSAKRKPYSAGN